MRRPREEFWTMSWNKIFEIAIPVVGIQQGAPFTVFLNYSTCPENLFQSLTYFSQNQEAKGINLSLTFVRKLLTSTGLGAISIEQNTRLKPQTISPSYTNFSGRRFLLYQEITLCIVTVIFKSTSRVKSIRGQQRGLLAKLFIRY